MNDEFDSLVGEISDPTTSKRTVPNVFPTITNTPYRLAIVGEAPGEDEVNSGTPFIGASGRELNKILDKAHILRDACFIGNVCQHRPPGNKLAEFDWFGPEIQNGLDTLSHDLSTFRPNLIWCLGGAALHAFKCGSSTAPGKRKTKEGLVFVYPNSITDWRGSLFLSHLDSPLPNTKTVASIHPAAAIRNYSYIPLILLDACLKVQKESLSPTLILPQRKLVVNLSFDELLSELRKVQTEKPLLSVDIEGVVGAMSCLSLATSPSYSFIVPFTTTTGSSLWRIDEEVIIWRELSRILSDASIPKVLQNSLYDRFVLQYSYGLSIRGVVDDTMLKHWELYCELEKGLGFLCSIYTNEPYYKSERKSDSLQEFHEYCCKDSATTLEISQKLDKWLGGRGKLHYQFNISLLEPLLYMELRGIKYNTPLAKQRLKEVNEQIYGLQHSLDTLSGRGLSTTDKTVLRANVRDQMCYKRDISKVKAEYTTEYDPIMRLLLGEGSLTKAQLGRISTALGVELNTKSPKLKKYLYEELSLPPQYNDGALTTDNEALLKLKAWVLKQ